MRCLCAFNHYNVSITSMPREIKSTEDMYNQEYLFNMTDTDLTLIKMMAIYKTNAFYSSSGPFPDLNDKTVCPVSILLNIS